MSNNVDPFKDIFERYFINAFFEYISLNKNSVPAKGEFETNLAALCERYLDYYNEFSYDFHVNGEHELLQKISKLPFKTIFDVGCNVGDWALEVGSAFPQAKIHTFELSKSASDILATRLSADNYILNNLALSDRDGLITYKDYGPNSPVNTIVSDVTFHDGRIAPNMIEVQMKSGDSYCAEQDISDIDFLKIDVEGAENLVIEGFSNLLERQAIRIIQFEYGYAQGDAKFLMKDFYKLFESFGYQVGKITRGAIEFPEWTYKNNDFKSGPNYVAVRKSDAEIIEILSKPS